MEKTIQDLEAEFNKEIEETLKKAQTKMKMELKNPITHQENSRESLTSGTNQAEGRISGTGDRESNKISKECGKNTRKQNIRNIEQHEKTQLLIYRNR